MKQKLVYLFPALLISLSLFSAKTSVSHSVVSRNVVSPFGEGIMVSDLHCEMLCDPEGINTTTPRFGWIVRAEAGMRNVEQLSYRILVASSPEKLKNNEADLWDSGEVNSSQSVYVDYAGNPLQSRSDAYWKVKVKTNKGESAWSDMAHFSVGLLDDMDWKAEWIGLDRSFSWDSETAHSRLSARYFRKEFDSKKVVRSAKVYISGLGLYELYINGQKIGDQALAPTPTDYTKSVKYNTFDVTSSVQSGRNAIGTILGNGRFYNMRQDYKPHKIKTFGYPKMLFQLEIEYTDGTRQTVVSDNTWKVTADGPIRSNNDFDGEEYDAAKELGKWNTVGYNDRKWLKAERVQAPDGKLSAQMNDNMKVMATVRPVKITALTPDTFIVDMGQNMVGWVQLTANGKKGDKITLRFAETLETDGRLKTINLRSANQTDVYTLKGGGTETWEPCFVTHGFRYMEVTGFPGTPAIDNFVGKVVYDNIATISMFETSNALLNRIHKNAYWGINGNYKGIPLDCPQRDERQPWLGDHTIGCFGESFMYDNERLYVKWLDDIRDSQTEEGGLSDIAPPYYMIYYSDNMTWPGTYLFVAEMIYQQFGNKEPVIDHYPSMKKWYFHMKNKYMTGDYIMTKDKYGDWCVPPEAKELIHSQDPARKTDGQLIATAYSYKLLLMLQKFAVIAGYPDDANEYTALAENIRNGFNRKFYNPETGQYDNHTVTANLLPLAFGMVDKENDERVFQNLIDRIVRNENLHISTGVIGTQWLMRELTKRGRMDMAYTIATQEDYPSWGYMVAQGATTIWELWNGDTASPKMNSHNHVMILGDLISWMYEDLAGIKSHKTYPGFERLWMKPGPTEDLTYVKASYKTPYGEAKSQWKLEDGIFTWKIIVPANTRANILLPAESPDDITESGRPVLETEGLKYVRMEGGRINLEIGSGEYEFSCKYGEATNRWKEGVLYDEFVNPGAPYPECHASTIAETKEGHLVAAWFGGTKERNPDVCIWVSRLIDGQWTTGQNVANGIVNDTIRYATWNPVLYQVPGGELQLYYKVGPNVAAWAGKVITSNDGGLTWSEPRDLPDGFLGPVKNKPVLLKNGTLICPSSTEGGPWKTHFELTKDFGKTWTKVGPINDGLELHTIQASVLVYKDGSLQILCRTSERALGESWSYDNGKTWSPMVKSSLPSTNSGTDAVTLQDGRQLIVYNHVLPHDSLPRGKGFRTPLNVAISDDGKTWYAAAVLEDSPIGQYSYPSVIQTKDGLVHIVYTWRREFIKHAVIDPSRLVLSKIENMKWPSLKEDKEIQVVNKQRYKVSVCDWMMLKRQKAGAMELAKELGADGLELDMGSLGDRVSFDNKLSEKHFQELFISECNRLGIQFGSVAMSAFYGQSFGKRDNYEQLVDECIATMKVLGVNVAFLPMGNQCDLVKEPELYPIVLERLKVVAKKAEAAGVVIGIETTLPTHKEAKLIDEVNSPAIKSYVNFSSMIKRGENIVKALKTLGAKRIVQIHATNTDGFWIENDPALNMDEIKKTLDKMGWSGWLVVERSRDTSDVHNVKRNYGANIRYLKSVFQK
ncbi:MAG: family 78 glycoside hydrolase catalytic domain [Tannerella sp.]|jgi:alpha-L-rhamnosidase|nr:family 78 glycoside hydrolase catalytic domain [Tannerella sp.]